MKKINITKKITPKTKIAEALILNPQAAEILFEVGFGCIGCHMSSYETLEQGLSMHGIGKKEINLIINKLNEGIKEKGVK